MEKVVGIIAEFNPMHKGHKYLIDKAKEITGADCIVCIMSGNFTQTGNIAVENKFKRAKVAIENGIDVVIELPTIFASSSTKYFAEGAVKILNSLGIVTHLVFGSETGNTDELVTIAEKISKNEDKIWEKTTMYFKSGISFAKAHEMALTHFLNDKEIAIYRTPNNILGIEYIVEMIKEKSSIIPIAIKREDNISATNIRELLSNKEIDMANNYTLKNIDKYVLNNDMLDLILYNVVTKEESYLENINEISEGIQNVIIKNIGNNSSYEEFIQSIKSKRYQLTRIKRILVNIMLDITKDNFNNLRKSNYAHILAINSSMKGEILSNLSKKAHIPVLTSLNDKVLMNLKKTDREAIELDIMASNIYSIISKEKTNLDYTNMI